MLNAADYGDTTTRTRFFLLAREDGYPVQWPEPSHVKGDTGMFPGRSRWRGAWEVIDRNKPGRSLLDDPKYIKKPLSEKTRQRIARGLERFGGPLARLYIRLLALPEESHSNGHHESIESFHGPDRQHTSARSLEEPVYTITTLTGGGQYLVEPVLEPFVFANRTQNAPRGIDDPIAPATTAPGGESCLVEPTAKPFLLGQQSAGAPRLPKNPSRP